ncbi:MAG: RimK family alpha-L-glutamate ligase [Candidatus Hodarchaeota archaeon]
MIWIVGIEETYESQRILQELKNSGLEYRFVGWNDITLPLREVPDLCVIRTPAGLMGLHVPYMLSVMEELERQGCRTIPSSQTLYKCDKLSTYLLWRKHLKNYIEMPETICTLNLDTALEFLKKRQNIVFKPIIGGRGIGVELIQENEVQILKELHKKHGILYLQEFIPNPGYDMRTLVIGENIASQYARYNPKEFRHNLYQGAIPLTINETMKIDSKVEDYARQSRELAFKVKDLFSLEMFAIDTIPSTEKELYFLEVNALFGFKGPKENIAKMIVNHLREY